MALLLVCTGTSSMFVELLVAVLAVPLLVAVLSRSCVVSPPFYVVSLQLYLAALPLYTVLGIVALLSSPALSALLLRLLSTLSNDLLLSETQLLQHFTFPS